MSIHRSIAASVVASAALVLGSALPARSDAVNDGGFWLTLVTQGDLGPEPGRHRIKWWFDGQLRLFEDSGGIGQGLVRPGIGYAITDSISLWAGYAYVGTDPTKGPPFNEQRIWQQALWKPRFERLSLDLRTRLEERFVEGGSTLGIRLRQLAGLGVPLDFAPRITPVISDEIFFNLNSTQGSAPQAEAGFDQNRFFVGLAFKLRPDSRFRIDAGYMNQYIRRPGNQDLSNNLFSLTLHWNFTTHPQPAAPAESLLRS